MKTSPKRLLLIVLASTFFAIISAGCNTTEGLGKDVERAGEKIQDNAR